MAPTMRGNSLYYRLVRPLMPRGVRLLARRLVAAKTLRGSSGCWPIDPMSGKAPEGWPGWPSGRRFALVLTHDVEDLRGVSRVARVARAELELGLVSSANFVPERYLLPAELRVQLEAMGCEVGVHDLRHDGKLFSSHRVFLEQSRAINAYLREWRAVGFRSGSMYHNLEWLKGLDIEYDASTFDTDPFEPQPDGLGTVFPLWIADGNRGRGYVELPYTLPQDHTLFVLLRHRDAHVWRQKLEWIVDHGGMALLNTHPDYMSCDGDRLRVDEYPYALYREFLLYVVGRYRGEYWNALPRDVARYFRSCMLPAACGPSGEPRHSLGKQS